MFSVQTLVQALPSKRFEKIRYFCYTGLQLSELLHIDTKNVTCFTYDLVQNFILLVLVSKRN